MFDWLWMVLVELVRVWACRCWTDSIVVIAGPECCRLVPAMERYWDAWRLVL